MANYYGNYYYTESFGRYTLEMIDYRNRFKCLGWNYKVKLYNYESQYTRRFTNACRGLYGFACVPWSDDNTAKSDAWLLSTVKGCEYVYLRDRAQMESIITYMALTEETEYQIPA